MSANFVTQDQLKEEIRALREMVKNLASDMKGANKTLSESIQNIVDTQEILYSLYNQLRADDVRNNDSNS